MNLAVNQINAIPHIEPIDIEHILTTIEKNEFIAPCIDQFEYEISRWRGVQTEKVTEFKIFREYFRYTIAYYYMCIVLLKRGTFARKSRVN